MNSPGPLTTPALFRVAAGVGLVVLTAAALLTSGGGALGVEAGHAALQERFDLQETLPLGFEVRDARRLSGSELYITLAAPGAGPEEPEPLPFEGQVAPKSKRSMGPPRSSFDPRDRTEWRRLKIRDQETQPVEAALLLVGDRKKADALLVEQFSRARFKDLDEVGGQGEAIPIDSGTLNWKGYEATWLHLRHYELTKDRVPTSHDTLRVNLTTTQEARVLYLRWARTYPGGSSAVEEWLSALSPRG